MNWSLEDIARMLRETVELLRDSDLSGLNTPIPVINQTPNDLLAFTDGLLRVAERIVAEPDPKELRSLRDGFALQLEQTSASPETLLRISGALDRVSRVIAPVQAFQLTITDGSNNSFETATLSSTATNIDLQDAINSAIGVADSVTVSGPFGGPFTLEFAAALGDVTIESSSPSGLGVQAQTLSQSGNPTRIAASLINTGSLGAALSGLRNAVAELPDGASGKQALEDTAIAMSGRVISTQNVGAYLTELLTAEFQAAGYPLQPGDLVVTVDFVGSKVANKRDTFKLGISLNPEVTRNVGFDLSLGDLGPLSVGSAVNVDVTLGGNIDLNLGFNFDTFTPYVFNDSAFNIEASIDSTLAAEAAFGGLQLGLDGSASLQKNNDETMPATIGVSVSTSVTPSDANIVGAIPISQFFSDGLGTTFDFSGIDGEIVASFDTTLPGETIENAITVNYDLATAVSGGLPTINYDDLTQGVNDHLGSLTDLSNMSLDQLISGTRTVLHTIESGLTSKLLSNLPLVGDGVDLGASFVGQLQSMLNEFEQLVQASDDSVDALIGEIQTLLFDSLGPDGADILKLNPLFHDDTAQSDVTEVADARDVEVSLTPLATTPADEVEFLISLNLAGRDVMDANFDLGLDALVFDFETQGGVELSWDYDMAFGFGINLRDGFFFQLNDNMSTDASGFSDGSGGAPELELSTQVNLKPGTSLSAELFFLNMNATSHLIEDYNGNGVLDTGLNEALDGIDHNRDGDTTDLLDETDLNGDGRLSRGTGLRGDIFIDFDDPNVVGNEHRLTMGDLGSAGSIFNAGIRTEAFVDLALSADTDAGSNLPALSTDFTVDWGLSYTTSAGFMSGAPDVMFHDVSLDMGSFFESIAGPAFEIFEEYIEPARPVIDFLLAEVPGFSDISTSTGGPKITFLDLGAYAAGLGDKVTQAKKVLETIQGILNAVDEFKGFAGADGIIINFGDFSLSGGNTIQITGESIGNDPVAGTTLPLATSAKAGSVTVRANGTALGSKDYQVIHGGTTQNPTTSVRFLAGQAGPITVDYMTVSGKSDVSDAATQVSVAAGMEMPSANDVLTQIENDTRASQANKRETTSKFKKLTRSGASGGHGLNVPLLSNPTNVFKLLTGETVDILQWDIPTFDLNIPFEARFGPLGPTPIFAKVGGNVGARLDFSIGFDTRGISQTGNFLDGLYFGDLADVTTGDDINEVEFELGLNVGVGIDILIASVYLVGGVRGDLGFDWNDLDGDGKLYLDELAALAQLPSDPDIPGACVFDAHGSLNAVVGIEWTLGVGLFGIDGYIPIIDEELFSFDYTCEVTVNAATLTQGDPNFDDGTLRLNAGPFASLRDPGESIDDNEVFTVRQVGDVIEVDYDLVVNETTTVTITREYDATAVNAIYFDGGAGDDRITIDPSVTKPVTLIGGAGNDTLIGGNSNTTFVGGAGNDTLVGGTGNDRYLFENDWGVDSISDADGDSDRFDFSAVTTDLEVTLGSVKVDTIGNDAVNNPLNPNGQFVEGIESFIAGGGNDTLKLHDAAGTTRVWTVDGPFGAGNIDDEFAFERFENFDAGPQNDVFRFVGEGEIDGQVSGGGGNDTITYASLSTPVEVDLHSSTSTSLGSFVDIEGFVGGTSSTDNLIGPNVATTWDVTGTDAGTAGAIAYESFENLTGGDAADTFTVAASGSITGNLLGSRSLNVIDGDTLNLSAKTAALTATIQGTNQGQVSGGTNVTFDRVENLIGGSASDHFVIQSLAGLTGTIDGGAGDEDHLDYSAWNSSVSVNFDAGTNHIGSVAGMEWLTGGSANDDLTGNASNNRIVGRGGGDTIDGLRGNNVLVGDQASLTTASITTLANSNDGDDDIDAGDGNNIILPGGGNDVVDAGNGNNVVGGDQSIVTLSGGMAIDLQSGTGTGGGGDTITLGSGNNLVIGGEGADTITVGTSGSGNNAILGDRGVIDRIGGETSSITSESTNGAGADTITTGGGVDAIIGGGAGDTIIGGDGNNYVLGDDGSITFVNNLPKASTLNPQVTDGNENITTGGGRDIIFTSDGDNTVVAGDGHDDVFGGSGIDDISGGAGNDWLVGLLGNDEIDGDAGHDVLFGGIAVGTRADYFLTDQSNLDASKFQIPDEVSAVESKPQYATGYTFSTLITPMVVGGVSIDGVAGDGRDTLDGGDDNDVVFGGVDADTLIGGGGVDYLDGGAGLDSADGGAGDDVVRGGEGGDVLEGGTGIDQLIGDGGDDELKAESSEGSNHGQRLFGGDGRDVLRASAGVGTDGDQLFGGSGSDFLYGTGQAEVFVGGSGNDFVQAGGGDDLLQGGTGEDELLGGDGADTIWGGAGTDYVAGQAGSDTQYGGGGIDLFLLPITTSDLDVIDGHFGNEVQGDVPDDNATDIMTIDGTGAGDEILIGEITSGTHAGKAGVLYNGMLVPVDMFNSNGDIVVEQFRIAGLAGNDTIGFYTELAQTSGALASLNNPIPNDFGPLDLTALADRSKDFVGVFDGNSGNDLLLGSDGRDRLDGGIGSDTGNGFGGSDRLWGDNGGGLSSDIDTLYAGQGDDDLVGGQGKNKLYAWSFDPELGTEFGAFIDENGAFFTDSGDGARTQEATGLNRILGSSNDDSLYGGTVLDFMVGNGGNDTLYRADGTTFESADGGIAGDEWKEYARESDQVWYVGGSNAADQINVDFVTEPGLLTDHHLITRLTDNNGNFNFSAQVKLDFTATDDEGKAVWNPNDLQFSLDELNAAGDESRGEQLSAIASSQQVESDLLQNILPPEADFLVIIVDALDGNDEVIIGPTVQKTVWVDAGAGDDIVEIRSGNAILVDRAESSVGTTGLASRNDIPAQAFDLFSSNEGVNTTFGGKAIDDGVVTFTGLSIDSPADEDWYAFTLADVPTVAGKITLASGSPIDNLGLELFKVDPDSNDAPNDSNLISLNVGTSSGASAEIDLPVQTRGRYISVRNNGAASRGLHLGEIEVFSPGATPAASYDNANDLALTAKGARLESITGTVQHGNSGSLLDGDGEGGLAAYTLNPGVGNEIVIDLGQIVDIGSIRLWQRNENVNAQVRLSDFTVSVLADNGGTPGAVVREYSHPGQVENFSSVSFDGTLGSLDAETRYLLKVSNPNAVPTLYDLRFNLSGVDVDTLDAPLEINMSLREDTERRDVIIGGLGDDILRGGAGEDWIFGNEGNDVLTGGDDRNASDLLFGGLGDDTFQIIPDALPMLGNQPGTNFNPATETFIPTYSEQLIGGEGTDRILYLGGDTDRRGFDVPDYVSMRYNNGLHRYEFTSLVWDIGRQEFLTTFIDRDGSGDQNGNEPTVYQQESMFFQTRDVENIQFSLQAGDDVLHLDPEFQFLPIDNTDPDNLILDPNANPSLYEEWGMDRGDAEQGAFESIIINGGDGDDFLFGTPKSDTIFGGPGDDYIVGGLGNDNIDGGAGADQIFGNSPDTPTTAYPIHHEKPQFFEFFNFEDEVYRHELAAPFLDLAAPGRSGVDLSVGSEIPAGPILHYSFDDPGGLGVDASGNGNTASSSAGVSLDADGIAGGSARFADANSVILVGASGVDAGSEWTASAWFKGVVDTSAFNTLFRSFGGSSHQVLVDTNSNNLGSWDNGFHDSGYDLDPSSFAGEWHQVTAVGASNETQFYVDGQFVGSTGVNSSGNFYAIGNFQILGQKFADQLDEVYIYDRALSAHEVGALYGAYAPKVTAVSQVDETAFGLENGENGQLSPLRAVGDFNNDGHEDFITSGSSTSYLLLGPVELTDLEIVDTYAEILIDHTALGSPVRGLGDIDGDGTDDLAFERLDGQDVLVTVVYGGEVARVDGTTTTEWSRYWDQAFVDNVLKPSQTDSIADVIRISASELTSATQLFCLLILTGMATATSL
ncbi:MAG: LamG-like jellyroll fold domain-containing protein [Planctomycetota bacterium]